MEENTKSIFIVNKAFGNGFGDIESIMISVPTMEEGVDLIYQDLIKEFAENREEKYLPDWCPRKEDIIINIKDNGGFSIPNETSNSGYDYYWGMKEVKIG